MKTITLDYDQAHRFIDSNVHRGYYWDGWTINRWVPGAASFLSKNGMFKNDRWGARYTFPLKDNGTWDVKVPNNVEFN